MAHMPQIVPTKSEIFSNSFNLTITSHITWNPNRPVIFLYMFYMFFFFLPFCLTLCCSHPFSEDENGEDSRFFPQAWIRWSVTVVSSPQHVWFTFCQTKTLFLKPLIEPWWDVEILDRPVPGIQFASEFHRYFDDYALMRILDKNKNAYKSMITDSKGLLTEPKIPSKPTNKCPTGFPVTSRWGHDYKENNIAVYTCILDGDNHDKCDLWP